MSVVPLGVSVRDDSEWRYYIGDVSIKNVSFNNAIIGGQVFKKNATIGLTGGRIRSYDDKPLNVGHQSFGFFMTAPQFPPSKLKGPVVVGPSCVQLITRI